MYIPGDERVNLVFRICFRRHARSQRRLLRKCVHLCTGLTNRMRRGSNIIASENHLDRRGGLKYSGVD